MDARQQGHITRTRDMLEKSSISQESKEAMHDLLTSASLTANGVPENERLKYGAETMLALSNVVVRSAAMQPLAITAAIAQHAMQCVHAQQKTPTISWKARWIIPAGSIRGSQAVNVALLCFVMFASYATKQYLGRQQKALMDFQQQTVAEEKVVANELADTTKKTAVVLAREKASNAAVDAKNREDAEVRIVKRVVEELMGNN